MIRYEYYDIGDDSAYWSALDDQQYRVAQTFTVGTVSADCRYSITNAKLKLYRKNAIGEISIQLWATVDGLPNTGLRTCTYDGDSITEDAGGAWYLFDFAPYQVTEGVKYAVVISAQNAGEEDDQYLYWRRNSEGGYAGGIACDNSGPLASWQEKTGDMMFEIYGMLSQDMTLMGDMNWH